MIGPNDNYPQDFQGGAGGAVFVQPYKLGSGSMRGQQIVGFGKVKIDSGNNRIVLSSTGNFNSPMTIEAMLGDLSSDAADQSFGFKITDANGMTLTLGILSDGTLGMNITDSSGFELFKLSSLPGGTQWDWFDKNYQTNTMRAGLLPDGNFGWVTTPPANNISDAFGS